MTAMAAALVPSGRCQCGCGQGTRLAPHTHRARGWVRGEPMRYVYGHYRQPESLWFRRHRKYRVNVSAFLADPVGAEAAYWAGFLFADGCVPTHGMSVQTDLQARDRSHLEKLAAFMCPTIALRPSHGGRSVCLEVCGKRLVAALQRFGIVPRKSYTHPLPVLRDAEWVPFIRGFFDGDGCFGVYRQKPKSPRGAWLSYPHWVLTGARNWLAVVRDALRPVTGTSGTLCAQGNIWHLRYVGRAVPRIRDFLRGEPCLQRKWALTSQPMEAF